LIVGAENFLPLFCAIAKKLLTKGTSYQQKYTKNGFFALYMWMGLRLRSATGRWAESKRPNY